MTSASSRLRLDDDVDDDREADDVTEDGEEAGGKQLLHRCDVVLDARHDAADLVVVVEAQGELLKVGEHLYPQLQEDAMADPAGVEQLHDHAEP